jgi:hypothetical protein
VLNGLTLPTLSLTGVGGTGEGDTSENNPLLENRILLPVTTSSRGSLCSDHPAWV